MHKVLRLISPGANSSRCWFLLLSWVQILITEVIQGANLQKMRVLDQVKVQKMWISLKGAEFLPKVQKSVIILHYIFHTISTIA